MASTMLRFSKRIPTAISFQPFKRLNHAVGTDFQKGLSAPIELGSLDNNLRVACQNRPDSGITTVGICVDAGSRYEEGRDNGAGHLLQRLAFKGTSTRTKAQLDAELAKLGARANAVITREQMGFYAKCLDKDVPKIVEILSDVVCNPKFDETELNEDRAKLLKNVENTEANIKDVVFDYLHTVAYQGTPLGQTIIGPIENIKSLTARDLRYYHDTHFKSSRIVLAASGGVTQNELQQLAEKHLSKLDNTFDGEPPVLSPCRFTGSEVRVHDDSLPFAYFAIGVQGPGNNSADRIPIQIGAHAIGKYDRSMGRFNDSSPYDICHSFESFNITYSDTGLFGGYIVCEPMQCDSAAESLLDTWQRLCHSVTDVELNTAKNQLVTHLIRKYGGTEGSCELIGQSVLAFNRGLSLNELVHSIQSCSNEQIREVADKYINNKCPVIAAVGPVENLLTYSNYRTKTNWLRV